MNEAITLAEISEKPLRFLRKMMWIELWFKAKNTVFQDPAEIEAIESEIKNATRWKL